MKIKQEAAFVNLQKPAAAVIFCVRPIFYHFWLNKCAMFLAFMDQVFSICADFLPIFNIIFLQHPFFFQTSVQHFLHTTLIYALYGCRRLRGNDDYKLNYFPENNYSSICINVAQLFSRLHLSCNLHLCIIPVLICTLTFNKKLINKQINKFTQRWKSWLTWRRIRTKNLERSARHNRRVSQLRYHRQWS